MADFTSGYLVFKNVPTLGAAHSLASQMARLNSDVHILDVGFLVKGAWVAAWVSDIYDDAKEKAVQLAGKNEMQCVQVSAATLNAMYSLGTSVDAEDKEALIVEADELAIADFIEFIEECLKMNWKLLEIRFRKSGPAGIHAFLAGPSGLSINNATGNATNKVSSKVTVARTTLSGDYRRYF